MTCNDMSGWRHQLLCEPMNDNPWTYAVLLVTVVVMVAAAVMFGRLVDKVWRRIMFGISRDKSPDDDQQAAADTIATARAGQAPTPLVTEAQMRERGWEGPDNDGTMHLDTARLEQPRTGDGYRTLGLTDGSGSAYVPDPVAEGYTEMGTTGDGGRVFIKPNPFTDSGVHALPDVANGHKVACTHCEGNGYVIKTTSDLLRESIALVGDGGDVIVREFYTRLFAAAPDLAALFPADLLTTDETHRQRDRLLKAIVALSENYDPNNPAGMDRLDTALAAYGRSHSRFAYPDGTERGATLEQYAAVKATLFEVLVITAGEAWIPAYTEAWSEAYDYAAGVMLAEARRGGQQFARLPRA